MSERVNIVAIGVLLVVQVLRVVIDVSEKVTKGKVLKRGSMYTDSYTSDVKPKVRYGTNGSTGRYTRCGVSRALARLQLASLLY